MDEYISREAVVRYLKGFSEKELNGRSNFGMVTSSVLDKAERAISEMPAADVQPVKHGRWIDTGSGQECSICKEIQYGYDTGRHYCPNCCSKNRMDGDGK